MQTRSLTPEFAPFLEVAPPEAVATPSMMTPHERYFVYNLIRHGYQGRGVIYDGGTFLGASTVCFGQALKDHPNRKELLSKFKRPIKSFELGIFRSNFQAFFDNHNIRHRLKDGDSFEFILRDNIRKVQDLVDLKMGDLRKVSPCPNRIEVFYSDVMKLPSTANYMVQTYFPKLLPKATLIEQDYFTTGTPWIPVVYEYFADHFEYIGEISSMAIFRLRKIITQDQADEFVKNYPDPVKRLDLIGAAIQRSIDPNRRLMLSLAKLQVIQQVLGQKKALDYLDFIKSDFSNQLANKKYKRLHALFAFSQSACKANELIAWYMMPEHKRETQDFDLKWAEPVTS